MPKNAALYISDPSLIRTATFARFQGFIEFEALHDEGEASGLRLTMTWGRVRMNFMSQEMLPSHLEGLAAYAEQHIEDSDTEHYLRSRFAYVQMALGCNLEHAPDDEERAQEFLFDLNADLNGLLFLADSVHDRDGANLTHPEE
ncbi:MAG: hypothetical protein RL885_15845 [Planctomycetota bacterium]